MAKTKLTLEQKLSRIKAIADALQQPDLELEQGITFYEEAMQHISEAKQYLAETTLKIEKLKLDA